MGIADKQISNNMKQQQKKTVKVKNLSSKKIEIKIKYIQ
jgi:hypothetical protein